MSIFYFPQIMDANISLGDYITRKIDLRPFLKMFSKEESCANKPELIVNVYMCFSAGIFSDPAPANLGQSFKSFQVFFGT